MAEQIAGSLDLTSPLENPAKIGAWVAKMTGAHGAWDWRGDAANVATPILTVHGVRDKTPDQQRWVTARHNR